MKSLKIFYLLVVYVLLQLGWWSYLLIKLNGEVSREKIKNLQQMEQNEAVVSDEQAILKKLKEKYWMVAGEGIVFVTLLGLGIYHARKAFRKEYQVALQQKNFMMSITHEFKSPIAGIRLSLETLLRRDMEKQQQDKILGRALMETDRINFLVENILTATQIEASNMDFQFAVINLSETLKELLHIKQTTMIYHKLNLSLEPDIHIQADKNAMVSLVLNLLENAEKYTPENSNVEVKLFQLNHEVYLQVCDNGPGIPDSEKRKIFEKFYRIGNEETRTTKGTGLGLYISRFIALKHKGRITVKDNYPQGCIFEAVFPAKLQ
jgi:signal transduction histidine kinase